MIALARSTCQDYNRPSDKRQNQASSPTFLAWESADMVIIVFALLFMLLTAANVIAYRSKEPTAKIVFLCLAFVIVPGFFLYFSAPPLAITAMLLIVALVIWRMSSRGPSFFRSLSIAATLLALGIVGALAWRSGREYDRLRARYPYESMEVRLPTPKPSSRATPIAAVGRKSLEDRIVGGGYREYQLKRLHEDAVGLFVDRFGVGYSRMPSGPTEWNLALNGREGPDVPQPGPRAAAPGSPGEWLRLPADEGTLSKLHEAGIFDFAFPPSFGYFKDRRHVAGFAPHRFSKVPVSSPTRWKVRTLDLVGLLLNDEPRVYVSANLPRMGELRGAPTRPLDKFESVGLAAIRSGDDLLTARDGDAIRMVGAIRSATKCVACHGGERGDLLGAFSYVLKPDEKAGDHEPRPE